MRIDCWLHRPKSVNRDIAGSILYLLNESEESWKAQLNMQHEEKRKTS